MLIKANTLYKKKLYKSHVNVSFLRNYNNFTETNLANRDTLVITKQ